MTHRIAIVLSALPVWFLAAALSSASPARACGFTEAPVDCGDSAESEARYMLNRVVAAVGKDKAKALDEFSRGEEGFRTVDSYVFCIGPDGVMTAHPSAMLRGQDVRALHDETGNYFIATMLKTAEAGKVAQIRYLFPRPGATTASAKTTWYTRAGDQVCAVGVYDDGDAPSAPQTLDARLAGLRQRLAAGMPASLGADWTAYQQALDEQSATRTAAIAKAREQIRAADSALTVDAMSAAPPR
jgi:hypothetical protein